MTGEKVAIGIVIVLAIMVALEWTHAGGAW